MKVYTARDVAKLLDLSVAQVLSYARAGLLKPDRGTRGEYRFSFQDLVLLRTTKGLMASRIAPRKLRRALRKLSEQLPSGRPLSGVQIAAMGDRVVVRDGDAIWNPESGQACFNFDVAELAQRAAPHIRKIADQARQSASALDADEWYSLGCELETGAPDHARDAYRRSLELDPAQVEARINLGRLLQEGGHATAAESHYRLALAFRPGDATILFNLAVCLEDQKRVKEAIETYRESIKSDPGSADAHFNLARLYEDGGDSAAALRHLKIYRKLIE
jgi:tetratricopeptide (TPR) repeat protein